MPAHDTCYSLYNASARFVYRCCFSPRRAEAILSTLSFLALSTEPGILRCQCRCYWILIGKCMILGRGAQFEPQLIFIESQNLAVRDKAQLQRCNPSTSLSIQHLGIKHHLGGRDHWTGHWDSKLNEIPIWAPRELRAQGLESESKSILGTLWTVMWPQDGCVCFYFLLVDGGFVLTLDADVVVGDESYLGWRSGEFIKPAFKDEVSSIIKLNVGPSIITANFDWQGPWEKPFSTSAIDSYVIPTSWHSCLLSGSISVSVSIFMMWCAIPGDLRK